MRQRQGFTLVEVLVVLTVMFVIMAITVPAYLHSKQKAYQTQCVSNLRQLGMAISAYAQDNSGCLPSYRNLLPEDDPRWDEAIESGTTNLGSPDYRLLYQALNPYVRNKAVWFCPSDPYVGVNVLRWRVRHVYSSYHFDLTWSPPMSSVSYNSSVPGIFQAPCQCEVVRDANWYVGTPLKATLPEDRGRGCEHFKGTNNLYLDGHVKWRKSSWSPLPE